MNLHTVRLQGIDISGGGRSITNIRKVVESMPIWLQIVSTCGTLFFGCTTLYFASRGSKRTDVEDIKSRVRENTQLNMKLDEISRNVSDTKIEVSSLRKDINSHNERLIKVEESCKSAHHRLNMLENRINGDKEE